MRKFLAGVLASTMMLEMGTLPVLARETENSLVVEQESVEMDGTITEVALEEMQENESQPVSMTEEGFTDEPELAVASAGVWLDVSWATGGKIQFDSATGTITDAEATVTNVTIPSTINGVSVKEIGNGAFYQCNSLTAISFPSSLTTIGAQAFYECSKLKTVNLPDTVTSIGMMAFYNCSAISSLTLSNGLKTIERLAFHGCSGLSALVIPNSVTEIGNEVFVECSNLTSVVISNSVTTLGKSLFTRCTKLTTITIPESVKTIDQYAFLGCSSLKNVYYSGTKEQWETVNIGDYNVELRNANILFSDGEMKPSEDHKLSINKQVISLAAGRTETLKVLEDTFGEGVTWRSDNTAVATVSTAGKITAKGEGTTTIRAMSKEDKGLYVECTVSVSGREISMIDHWSLTELGYQNFPFDFDQLPSKGISMNDYISKTVNYTQDEVFFKGTMTKRDHFLNNYADFSIVDGCVEEEGLTAIAFADGSDNLVISYRGSIFLEETPFDLWNWFESALDLAKVSFLYDSDWGVPDQFVEATEFYLTVKKKYPDKNITLTGHSMGGAIATFVSILCDVKAVTFNSAAGTMLEDTYYGFYSIIPYEGLTNWKFENHYMELDAIGSYRAREWYKSYVYEKNSVSDRSHDLNAFLSHYGGSGEINVQPYVRENKYYLQKDWVGTYDSVIGTMAVEYIGGKVGKLTHTGMIGSAITKKILSPLTTAGNIYLGSESASRELSTGSWDAVQSHLFFSAGNSTFTGDHFSSDLFVLKDGDTAYGLSGGDRYIIDEEKDFKITIVDSSGDDLVYLKNFELSDITNVHNHGLGHYSVRFGEGENADYIFLNVYGDFFSLWESKITFLDKNGNEKKLSDFPITSSSRMDLTASEGTDHYASISLLGENITVSVLDAEENVLGTFSNRGTEISSSTYANVFPYGDGMDIEVFNNGKYVRIDQGTDVVGRLYTGARLEESAIYEFDCNSVVLLNTLLDDENNFLDASDSSVEVSPLPKVESMESSKSNVQLYVGESTSFDLTFNNGATDIPYTDVMIDWEEEIVGFATISQEDDTITVTGASSGAGTLIITARSDASVSVKVPVTIQQEETMPLSATAEGTAYEEKTWTSSPVTVTSPLPSGYDSLVYIVNSESSNTPPTISREGKTTVLAYAFDSKTGKYTKPTEFEVWIDSTAPVVTGVEHGGAYYIGKMIHILDTNYRSATINGVALTNDEYYQGKLITEVGTYTLVAEDESGKTTTVRFEIKELPLPIEENSKLIAEIRDDFESNYYDFSETLREQYEVTIRALEDALAKVSSPHNSDNDILAFRVPGQLGYSTIDTVNKTVSFVLPSSALTQKHLPILDIPKGTSISSNASQAQDFSTEVTYTITAIDNSVSTWTVKGVAPEKDGIEASLKSYTVKNNVIMLEFDSYLNPDLLIGKDQIKLVHSTDSA